MSRPARFALHHPVVDGVTMIDGAELHHLRNVKRLGEGSTIALLGDDNVERLARVERLENDRALVRIESTLSIENTLSRESASKLILAPAVIKGPRMDFLIEKASELGVTELWPMLCARGVVRAPGVERIGRWRRLAIAAAKQSLTPSTMKIGEPIQFADLMESLAKDGLADSLPAPAPLKMICTLGAEPLAAVIRRAHPRAVIIACGPEGHFTDSELELARGAGFVGVGLGNNRLRSETAALAAVSIAALLLDEFAGD